MSIRLTSLILAGLFCLSPLVHAMDTDKDGFPDGLETELGTDPNSASSTPTGSSITPQKIDDVFISVSLDFVNSTNEYLYFYGYLTVPQGTDFTGKKFAVDIGGFTAMTIMLADGSGDPAYPDVGLSVTPITNGSDGATHYFSFSVFNRPLQSLFTEEGLTNETVSDKVVMADVSYFILDKLYSGTLNGLYNATANSSGSAYFDSEFNGVIPEVLLSEFFATPNPIAPNTETLFRAALKVTGSDSYAYGYLDFGDGSPQVALSNGPSLADKLREGIPHTYTAIGVYQAELIVYISGFSSKSFKTFVLVGNDAVVNVLNGLIVSATVDNAGLLTLNINIANIPDATDAQTLFEDFNSQGIFAPGSRATQVDGLIPSRTVSTPGISVATTTAVDGTAQPRGKIRKMVPIGGRNVGDSGALPPPAVTEVVLKKVSGKFAFVDGKPDQVSFQGTFTLPTGFDPAKAGGNTLVFGIGNIVDRIQIDAKGKPLDKSASARGIISKVSVKYPKLAGPAVGGEIATLSVTIGMNGMSAAGFDTEGITPTLRADEANRKSVPRFIQVNVLLAEVAYDALLPVSYKVSKKGDSGAISGRAATGKK